jgi:uncharacterized membrane protein
MYETYPRRSRPKKPRKDCQDGTTRGSEPKRDSAMNVKMTPGKEKFLIAALCGAGIFLVAYGMIQKNHPVFLLGIVTVVAAYLGIRRKLKQALRENKRP